MNVNRKYRSLLWILCFLSPVLVIFLLTVLTRNYSEPNYVWPTQMQNDAAASPYEANPVLPIGFTMQQPVEGTIPRGYQPFHYDTTDASLILAGRELKNPFQPDERNLNRGKEVYENFCQVCHGSTGAGDGPIIPKYPNPVSYHTSAAKARMDGEMFHIITLGRNNMPSHSSQVDRDDRWKVILYIRQLQNR